MVKSLKIFRKRYPAVQKLDITLVIEHICRTYKIISLTISSVGDLHKKIQLGGDTQYINRAVDLPDKSEGGAGGM